ncbi:MAG: tetratricopeptide repeat protein [Flavobacteriales bacterium]|nr:tetratricopeptide repeat protein [Flavobacteriales bacterium]
MRIEQLANLISTQQHDSTRAAAYIELSTILYTSDLDTLLYLSKKASEITEQNLNTNLSKLERETFIKLNSEALANIGFYYQTIGDYSTARSYYLKCLKLDREIKNLRGLSSTFNNMGMLFTYKGNIKKALKYYLISLKIDEFLQDDETIGTSLNNIAYTYEQLGDISNALMYYQKAQQYFQKQNDENSEAAVFINIGSIYRKQGKTAQSLNYFKQSLDNYTKLSNELGMASALLNIGVAYFDLKQFDSSLVYIENSLKYYKKNNRVSGITIALVNLGKIHLENHAFDKAIWVGEEALLLAKENGNLYNIQNSAQLLSKAYQQKDRYKDALQMHQLYINSRDSIENNETQRSTIQQQLAYDYEKKELLSRAENDKKLAIAQSEKQKQKAIILIVSIGLILALILGLFALNRWRITQKQKILIEEKNNKINLLLGEIHHRVKNNLQVVSSLLSLQERNIKDETAKTAISEGKERVKSIGLIHKMLYQNDNYTCIEMNSFVHELANGLISTFDLNKVLLKVNIENIKIDVDTAIPLGLILNELIMNSLKYAFYEIDKPNLNIKLFEKNKQMVLEFSDNGKGKAEDLKNSTHSFGMKLIHSLTRQLNGNLSIINADGLKITITFASYKLV